MINLIATVLLFIQPGDKIVWGDSSNCKGIVLEVNGNLLKVSGTCMVKLNENNSIPFLVQDYISLYDVKKKIN